MFSFTMKITLTRVLMLSHFLDTCYHIARHLGELKFKQKGREEQCEPDNPTQAKKVKIMIMVIITTHVIIQHRPTLAYQHIPALLIMG